MQTGAADYIAKPFDHDELLHSVRRILDKTRLQRQNAALKSDLQRDYPVAGIIGECDAMRRVFQHVRKVGPTDSTVLILGESGTGKELVARAVHDQSHRCDAALVAVNCAAIPEELIESELFGHERGAFTGAVCAREGLVEAAHGGTLFLDEIGELPLTAQARLLRVLQAGEIRRVGSSRTSRVDVRLIAATHRNLAKYASQGLFREDLYYRLRVMEIILPPLRERNGDIVTLANYMLEKVCNRLNRPRLRLSSDALTVIQSYRWPGNVRELENAVERAVILGEGEEVTVEQLAIPGTVMESMSTGAASTTTANLSLDEYFLHYVLRNQEHMTETEIAKGLGISRKSLWERRQRLGIPRAGKR
jgi:DNA-binding NtrC family response regulator